MSGFQLLGPNSPEGSPRADDRLVSATSAENSPVKPDAEVVQDVKKPGFFARMSRSFFGKSGSLSTDELIPGTLEDDLSNTGIGELNANDDGYNDDDDDHDNKDNKQRSSSCPFVPVILGTKSLTFESVIFTQQHAIALYEHIPKSLQMQNIKLAYSMLNDGR
jgi:hypothetical protein